jgi:hypothetical protein
MLSTKAKRLMLPVASFNRANPHSSLSVVVLRNCITTPKMGVA